MVEPVTNHDLGVARESLLNYFPDGRFDRRLVVLAERRVVFVKNAKSGTSTVLLWLHRIHTGDHDFTPELSIHREHRLPRPDDVDWETTVRMLVGGAYRFSFVREPVRRAESAYIDKITRSPRSPRWRLQIQRALSMSPQPDRVPTFAEFVAALEQQEPIEMDPHWRPQYLNLMHPLVEYDHIGRLETFDSDLARIREAAGLPDVPLQARNVKKKRSDPLSTPDLRRRIEQIYARDFELYGY